MQTSGRSRSTDSTSAERVTDRGRHLMTLVGQQVRETFAEQDAVLRDHDPRGIPAWDRGLALGREQVELPVERAHAVAQAGEARTLDEGGAAYAVVLHLDVRRSPLRRTVTLARVAFPCFATLASASLTTK